MKPSSRKTVHRLVAARARISDQLVDDAHTFDELGVDPLGLLIIVVQLGTLGELQEVFPIGALERARTVGELVDLVDARPARATAASLVEGRGR
ncbi:MAG: phosphopantetheine-binding protein [Myxococcota bacterium]|nr:phosphopantetheine-binding protein [Myxococcota bacterium]